MQGFHKLAVGEKEGLMESVTLCLENLGGAIIMGKESVIYSIVLCY